MFNLVKNNHCTGGIEQENVKSLNVGWVGKTEMKGRKWVERTCTLCRAVQDLHFSLSPLLLLGSLLPVFYRTLERKTSSGTNRIVKSS